MPIEPKYYQVKMDILSKIKDGTYKQKETLPSEKELMKRYNSSRITIRKALDDLANEGYLYKIQGKGTFVGRVTHKQGINILRITSCVSELRACGYATERVVLKARIVDCDEELAKVYGLCVGERYFEFERIYTGDGVPYSYEISYYLYRYVSGIEQRDLSKESIHTVLQDLHFYDMSISCSTQIKAILAKGYLSDLLRVEEGFPLLEMYWNSFSNEDDENSEETKCVERHLAVWRTDIIPVVIE